ncbi:MAG: serine hydroxymethyltransferase [Planctomycetota bacterium]|nr:serine hydroxymethyltransferase [Planctomycetota bacterium]
MSAGKQVEKGDRTPTLFLGGLNEVDHEASLFVRLEESRQLDKIILIPSESISPQAVRDALGTVFTNIYAEGYSSLRMTREEAGLLMDCERALAYHRRYSDRRFYKGTEFVNFIEVLAQRRAATVFATKDFPAERIFVNVQPLSGAAANNAVYEGFVEPGGVVMGMALTHGGHLTHGSEFNRSGRRYKVISYEVSPRTGRLDYDQIEKMALEHKPRMIIAGASAYPWEIDWRRLRAIADAVPVTNVMGGTGAILLADISHPAGLVVAGLFPNPVGLAHASTLTTHKTMCGPRGAIIVSTDAEVAKRIDNAVFPGEQGGPHINNIAAKAVAFKIAGTPEFKRLQELIVENCKALGDSLTKRGLKLVYGGTSTHLLVVDLNAVKTKSGFPLKGDIASNILDVCGMTCNRNTIPGDKTAADSSGVRFGTVFMTQRGLQPEHCDRLAELIARVLLGIETFGIATAAGKRGRGKIDAAIISETRKDVAAFIDKVCGRQGRASVIAPQPAVSAPQTGHPVNIPAERSLGIIEVRGERAKTFLQAACTADLADMQPGEARMAAFLDSAAVLIAEALIVHDGTTKHGEHDFKVISDSGQIAKLAEWLENLSDGFVKFDNDDPYAKIDGPVVVQGLYPNSPDLKVCAPRTVAFGNSRAAEIATAFVATRSKLDATDALSLLKTADGDVFAPKKPYFIGQRHLMESLYMPHFGKCTGQKDDIGPARTGPNTMRIRRSLHLDKPIYEWKPPQKPPGKSCLYAEHLKLTKKQSIVEFANWLMPVMYSGIADEHKAVRNTAALFDVSHMAVFDFRGPHAERFLDILTTNYVLKLKPGQSQYSYVLDVDGKVLDDIMVYRLSAERFIVVANAANGDKIKAWIQSVNSQEFMIDRAYPFKEIEHQCEFRDLKDPSFGDDMRVDLALQGPQSLAILQTLLQRYAGDKNAADAQSRRLASVKRAELAETTLAGLPVIVSRTGYTGEEYGYELFVHPSGAPVLWNALLDTGKPFGLKPAGLGARDSARSEAGLPLYGHELAGEFGIGPAEAGYGAFVKRHKPFFIGKRGLLQREATTTSEIVRFRIPAKGARAVRPGDAVVNRKGQYVGAVTSAALDFDGYQLGLAYIARAQAIEGTWLGIFSKREALQSAGGKLEVGSRVPLHEEAVVLSRFRPVQAAR